ncbi:bifunctional diaminohydroxyphosphoribosylaminopyrimidine deaminase/5-amino-6-(5-phosphoribosylamino)uracil reductase RibD [Virgibacillus ndiopensis]|uniref:bifunctional diaminohydroxyphosphoribosylaminopyrimidine deaminase/5-amino-6-(5-phosphoribosylamino)uracil reductase RibD n=1 Tax=Virgibacillus ndiopensis TaxID=2004408 RepID=UPI0011457963|nr:bifunctional diaminohydroxyphosphoribosylaminopyrimidine deaminase/5-amino-6-(5-phosphoribosylamino)uracil reductase RibD [Virgibacillus ndiopensis]
MNDEDYMKFALNLAKQVSGQTNPNPPVGAVVVKNGEIIGFGAHLRAGEAHAEVHALQMAGEKAQDATIYVTLEPCSHFGKTPPCADLIIEKGIKRAVVAVSDPNEKVAGRGVEKLRDAGIEVSLGILQSDAEQVNEVFFHYTKTKTPYVTVKSAVSLDGKTATVHGDSKWITDEEARLDVHHYRHKNDAILVGVNTVIADNPSLTTRLPNGGKNSLRVILDTHLRTPLHANVITDHEADTWIFIGKNVTEQRIGSFIEKDRVKIIQMDDKQINIDKVLKFLGNKGVMSLFVEGGSEVNGSLLEGNHINQLILYMAPKLIGGKTAPTAFAGKGLQSMAETLAFDIKQVEMISKDIKIIAIPRKDDGDVYRNN